MGGRCLDSTYSNSDGQIFCGEEDRRANKTSSERPGGAEHPPPPSVIVEGARREIEHARRPLQRKSLQDPRHKMRSPHTIPTPPAAAVSVEGVPGQEATREAWTSAATLRQPCTPTTPTMTTGTVVIPHLSLLRKKNSKNLIAYDHLAPEQALARGW